MKILAGSWHPGGMNAIVPVIKELAAQGNSVTRIGHEHSEEILKSHGMPYVVLADYGCSVPSIDAAARIIDIERPKLVLTGTSAQEGKGHDVIEHFLVRAANDEGIPSLSVLDFWGNYAQRFTDGRTGERFLPTKIAVMDRYAYEQMVQEGFDQSCLVITGNPHFDNLEHKARAFDKYDDVRKRIGLEQDVIGFYAASVFRQSAKEYGFWDADAIRLMQEVLSGMPNAGLVVKLHPRVPEEDKEGVSKMLAGAKNVKLVTNIHPHDIILASEFTVTPMSTLGIEAVYMIRPCASVQPGLKGIDHLSIVTKTGVIPGAYTDEDVRVLAHRLYSDAGYRSVLLDRAKDFRTDGKATQRVVELIYSLINKK